MLASDGTPRIAYPRLREMRGLTQRAVGLIGRRSLDSSEAYLFARCRSVHTNFMSIPIDVIVCDAHLQVLAVATMKPWRACSPCPHGAHSVIEAAAETASANGICPGTRLSVLAGGERGETGGAARGELKRKEEIMTKGKEMKKNTTKNHSLKSALSAGVALALCAALASPLAGCAPKKDAAPETPTSPASAPSAPQSDSRYPSIQAYLDSPAIKSQLATPIAQAEDGGFKLSVTAEGDSLVYGYEITDAALASALRENPDSLSAALAQSAPTFEAVARSLRSTTTVENPSVIVRYLDSQGTIAEREFFAPAK